jgi:hypothetical protein
MVRVGLLPTSQATALPADSSVPAQTPSAAQGPFFQPDVQALMAARCQLCHDASRNPMTGFPLRGDPQADYALLRKFASDPDLDAAPLLAVSRGEGHMGGPVMVPGSEGYTLLRDWLAAGMPFAADP